MLYLGDCREVLPTLAKNSIGYCGTDPPYEVGILGQGWDKTGVAFDVRVWAAVKRVLKPGAYLTAFADPKKYHRLVCAIEDAGFLIRDTLTWLKGGPNMPKGGKLGPAIDKMLGVERPVVGQRWARGTAAMSTKELGGTFGVNVDSKGRKKLIDLTAPGSPESAQWDGYGYNLKPAQELIVLAQKPFKGPATRNLLKWGVGALNVELAGAPRNGRDVWQWPPNVILSHHPECTLFECHPTCPARIIGEQSGICKSAGNKSPTTGTGAFGKSRRYVISPEQCCKGDTGTAARYFPTFRYENKATKREKTADGAVVIPKSLVSIKPKAVVRWLSQLCCPPGETTLDPFLGSGTAGIVAAELGNPFVGIEMDEEHLRCAEARIRAFGGTP